MREKLIEMYREAHKEVRKHCNDTLCKECQYQCYGANCIRIAKADYLIANGVRLETKQATSEENKRWIPVTERLPELGSHVLACGGRGSVFVVRSDCTEFGFGRMPGSSKYRSFTHWMPLPEAPQEK